MKTFILVTLLATSCASTPSIVDDIVNSNIEARGGRDRITSLNSIRATGTITGPGGRVAHVVREVKKPGLFRLEFDFQGTTSVFAHDGTSGWQVAPLQGQFAPLAMPAEADAASGADQRDIEGTLVDWKKKGHVVSFVGHEVIDGKDTFKLKTDMRGGGTRYDYVDAASHQIVRSDVTRIVQGHATIVETKFSDFRATDGLMFPRAIEMHVKDRPEVLRVAIDNIELNPPLDDARFRMP